MTQRATDLRRLNECTSSRETQKWLAMQDDNTLGNLTDKLNQKEKEVEDKQEPQEAKKETRTESTVSTRGVTVNYTVTTKKKTKEQEKEEEQKLKKELEGARAEFGKSLDKYARLNTTDSTEIAKHEKAQQIGSDQTAESNRTGLGKTPQLRPHGEK